MIKVQTPEIETARINNFELKSYLEKIFNVDKRKLDCIDKKLKVVGGPELKKAYEIEKPLIEELRLERINSTYPNLDLSFLKESIDYPLKLDEGNSIILKLPRFCVYHLNGSNEFSFSFSHPLSTPERIRQLFTPKISLYNFKDYLEKAISIKGFEKNEYGQIIIPWGDYLNDNEKFKFYSSVSRDLEDATFSTKFLGIIPDETRERIKIAENFFKKDEFYLIAEHKKEDWVESNIGGDPLVVGSTHKNKANLIDIFNPTLAENIIPESYTKKN